MDSAALHRDAIMFDGLIVSNWSRAVFDDMRRGGFIGVTMFPAFLRHGNRPSVDDYVEAIEYVVNVAGEDCVGIGTDHTQGYGREFFEWITHDKGYARQLAKFGELINPEGVRTIGELPNLTAAMARAGWPETRIRKIMGENWLGLLSRVWGEQDA